MGRSNQDYRGLEADVNDHVENAVRRLLDVCDESPDRAGLAETPMRVRKAWQFMCSGVGDDPASLLKTFEDGAKGVSEMVVVSNIPIYSNCEHHMLPFWGKAHVAYIPNGRIVGLSKIPRVVNAYARRLQVQERLTTQVADLLFNELKPVGVGVMLECRHMCMESRGVMSRGTVTFTSALRGAMQDDASTRAEFLALRTRSAE